MVAANVNSCWHSLRDGNAFVVGNYAGLNYGGDLRVEHDQKLTTCNSFVADFSSSYQFEYSREILAWSSDHCGM